MPRAKPKRGRPLAKDWKDTTTAAQTLGLSPDNLLQLRTTTLKAGTHWRCKNPNAAPNGRRYLFHVKRIEPLLVPQNDTQLPAASP